MKNSNDSSPHHHQNPKQWVLTYVCVDKEAEALGKQLRTRGREWGWRIDETASVCLGKTPSAYDVVFEASATGSHLPLEATPHLQESTWQGVPGEEKIRVVLNEDMARAGADYLIQKHPQTHRRKRLLISDMDSTVIANETLSDLLALTGKADAGKAITRQGVNGEIDFLTSLQKRVSLLKGVSTDLLASVAEGIQDEPSAQTLVATMQHHAHAKTILVSGGFRPLTTEVAKRLGFDREIGNTFVIENNRLTGELAEPLSLTETKAEVLHSALEEFEIPREASLAVGDGANDLMMLQDAGLGILFHGSATLQAKLETDAISLEKVSTHGLETLLYFQGYKKSEFITP